MRRQNLSRNVCFVIGAIGDEHAALGTTDRANFESALEVLNHVIEPACLSHGLEVVRADRIARPGEIPEQIFRLLRDARIVIADLTGGNSNVMYELGLRHTTGKLTIQIGERGKLPFDVSVIRTILFVRTTDGFAVARDTLSAAIRVGLSHGADLVSAARVWAERSKRQVNSKSKVTKRAAIPSSTKASQGDVTKFSDRLAQMTDGGQRPDGLLKKLSELANQITPLLLDALNILNHAPHYNQWDTTLSAWEDRLGAISKSLNTTVSNFSAVVHTIKPTVLYGLTIAKENRRDLGAAEFRSQVARVIAVVEDAFERVRSYLGQPFVGREPNSSFKRSNTSVVITLRAFVQLQPEVEQWKTLLGA